MAYSFSLKHIVILDVFAIACGFVLRVVAGAVVIDVEISAWLLICTVLLSHFIGLSKRRHELGMLQEGAENSRKVLREYSPYLLDQMISIVVAATIVTYALYTMSEETIRKFGTRDLVFTVPFVLYGTFRYLYLIHQKGVGRNPEDTLITDKPLMINIFLWVLAVGVICMGDQRRNPKVIVLRTFNPMEIPYIRMCHERCLGVGAPNEIDVVREDISRVNFGFTTKRSLVTGATNFFSKLAGEEEVNAVKGRKPTE